MSSAVAVLPIQTVDDLRESRGIQRIPVSRWAFPLSNHTSCPRSLRALSELSHDGPPAGALRRSGGGSPPSR